MTTSELHAVNVGGFATIAGSVMATYILLGVSWIHIRFSCWSRYELSDCIRYSPRIYVLQFEAHLHRGENPTWFMSCEWGIQVFSCMFQHWIYLARWSIGQLWSCIQFSDNNNVSKITSSIVVVIVIILHIPNQSNYGMQTWTVNDVSHTLLAIVGIKIKT